MHAKMQPIMASTTTVQHSQDGHSKPRLMLLQQLPDGLSWVKSSTAANARAWRIAFESAFEIALVVAFLKGYNYIRNTFGSTSCTPAFALSHALQVVHAEQALGLFWEQDIQAVFLPFPHWIRFWNIFYGTAHMGATIGVLIFLFVLRPALYQSSRTIFVTMNLLALLGYAGYPLMPPRLLNECHDRYGGCQTEFTFVDTMDTYGGLWSWRHKDVAKVSNHYAAMPSMHAGYSLWCALATFRCLPHCFWMKVLAVVYPLTTLYCITVTGNHFFLDAVFGALALVVATYVSAYLPRIGRGADVDDDPACPCFGGGGSGGGSAGGELLPVVGVPYDSAALPSLKIVGQWQDIESGPAVVSDGASDGGSASPPLGSHISLVNLKNR